MIRDYKVIQIDTGKKEDLENEVEKLIKEGYKPYGDLICFFVPCIESQINPVASLRPVYTQAMVIDDKEKMILDLLNGIRNAIFRLR